MFNVARGLLLGWVEFSGIGGFQERFVSELLEDGIRIKRVKLADGRVSGVLSPMHYRTAAVTARKHGVHIRAGRRGGLYFDALRYSKRAGLYVGALVFVMMISVAKSTVSDIKITGEAPTAQVIQILEECGITRGVSTHGLELSLAERRLLLEVRDAAWVDVSLAGCCVSVTVEGGTPAPDILDAATPCNLVSVRDAKIVEAIVRKGTLVAQVGSGVQKGGLLVSGTIADGGEKLLYRHASAEIIGEFSETREFFVPYRETLKRADGEKTEYKYLVFGDDVYKLFWGEAYVEDALYTEQTEIPQFMRGTPFRIRTGTFTKYRSVEVTRTDDDCLAELKKLKADFEENFYSEYDVVNAVEKYFPQEDGIKLEVEYTLRGDIAREQEIELGTSEVSPPEDEQ